MITLMGGAEVAQACGEPFVEPGATATDDVDGTVAVTSDAGDVVLNAPGVYVVTYTATDAAGNTATAQRTVTVSDTTPPVITLLGGAVTLGRGGAYVEPGYTVEEACDETVTVTVTPAALDTSTPGEYVLVYEAVDAAGNVAAIQMRTVTVNWPCAQSEPWTWTQPRLYEGAVAATRDCSIVAATTDALATTLGLYRFEVDGRMRWQASHLFEDHPITPVRVLEENNRDLLIVGDGFPRDMQIARYDADGNFMDVKSGWLTAEQQAINPDDAVLAEDGSVYVAGRYTKYVDGEPLTDPGVFHVDAYSGSVLWDVRLWLADGAMTSIVRRWRDGLFLTGWGNHTVAGDTAAGIHVRISERATGPEAYVRYASMQSYAPNGPLVVNPSGMLTVASLQDDISGGSIIVLDTADGTNAPFGHSETYVGEVDAIAAMVRLANGEYVVLASRDWVFWIASNGQLQAVTAIPGFMAGPRGALTATSDGGVVVIGWAHPTESMADDLGIVMKLAPDGSYVDWRE